MHASNASVVQCHSIPDVELGTIRPFLRRDVLFGDTGVGVFIRCADNEFVLRGRTVYSWLCAMAPLLDGSATLDELTRDLPSQQHDMFISLVATLLARGFVRDDVLEVDQRLTGDVRAAYAPQIAYIHHFVSEPERRFDAFRRAKVGIVASGGLASTVEQFLRDNGMLDVQVEPDLSMPPAGTDVLIVDADTVGLGTLSTLADRARTRGIPVIPVLSAGGRAFVGPLLDPAGDLGWETLVHRVAAGLDPENGAELWMRFAGSRTMPSAAPTPVHAAMLGTLVGFDVFRLLTGCLRPQTAGAVVVQNLTTLDVVTQSIHPHPADPVLSASITEVTDDTEFGTPNVASLRRDMDALGDEQGTDEPSALHKQAERYLDLVREHVGVFRSFADLDAMQSPVKVGRVEIGAVRPSDGSAPRRVTLAEGFHVMTPLQARFEALGRAALCYVDTWGPEASRELYSSGDLTPDHFDDWSGAVGATDGEEGSCPGVVGMSLVTGRRVVVPAAVVYPFSPYNRAGLALRSQDGAGYGGTSAEAARRALFSAVSRRAVLSAVRAGRLLDEVDLTAFEQGSVLRFLVDSCAVLGSMPVALDASLEGCGHTVVAFVQAPASEPAIAYVATATSLPQATTQALTQLLGDTQVGAECRPGGSLADLDPAGLPRSGCVVRPDDGVRPVTAVLDTLATSTDVVVVDTTFPDLARGGIRTARVLLTTPSGRLGEDAP